MKTDKNSNTAITRKGHLSQSELEQAVPSTNTNVNEEPSEKTRSTATVHDEKAAADTKIEADFFGMAIYTYTRKQALADGVQMQVPTPIAKEAGFKIPVFLTDTVFAECIDVPEGVTCQDEEGRTWDILTMLHRAIRNTTDGAERIAFSVYVRNAEDRAPSLVELHAVCSAMDFDDPSPAITVMMLCEV